MLNILAWCDVSKHFRITTDTSVADEIYVHIGDGAVVTFRQVETGLFLMDLESLAVARSILKSPKPKDSVSVVIRKCLETSHQARMFNMQSELNHTSKKSGNEPR